MATASIVQQWLPRSVGHPGGRAQLRAVGLGRAARRWRSGLRRRRHLHLHDRLPVAGHAGRGRGPVGAHSCIAEEDGLRLVGLGHDHEIQGEARRPRGEPRGVRRAPERRSGHPRQLRARAHRRGRAHGVAPLPEDRRAGVGVVLGCSPRSAAQPLEMSLSSAPRYHAFVCLRGSAPLSPSWMGSVVALLARFLNGNGAPHCEECMQLDL
mmetsp:Transcript_13863/g.39938  ORF Transcript_13863/g.39938 Transcript_13863/m.39938 type:complete len:210 (+) Transcript_13863:587-1216(+)